jgi:hypothetical protein
MLDVGRVADFAHFAIVDDVNPRYDLLANRCPNCRSHLLFKDGLIERLITLLHIQELL